LLVEPAETQIAAAAAQMQQILDEHSVGGRWKLILEAELH
jgi:hypothetical protein